MPYFVDLPDIPSGQISPADLQEREDRYRAYLDSIRAQLPVDAWAFAAASWHYNPADSRCLQQARVQKVTIRKVPPLPRYGHPPAQIRIRLFSAHRDGYTELVYKNVRHYDLSLANDWLYDEVSVVPGGVIHEVSVGPGKRCRIECDDIVWIWQPFKRRTSPPAPALPQSGWQTAPLLNSTQAYCVSCRRAVTMQNAQRIFMKNGRPAVAGHCGTCGTKIYRVGT